MVKNADAISGDFQTAMRRAGMVDAPVEHELQKAPHKPHALPIGSSAVYVFSLSGTWGEKCPAGAHRVLKVGNAGANSNARFQSQHYNPRSARSNLAKSLLTARVLWPYLGLSELSEAEVGDWIKRNTDRDNFYIPGTDKQTRDELERYLRGLLGPVFEGG